MMRRSICRLRRWFGSGTRVMLDNDRQIPVAD